MLNIANFFPATHSSVYKEAMTPVKITEMLQKYKGTMGFYYFRFENGAISVTPFEVNDLMKIDEIKYDLLVTDGILFLLYLDKEFCYYLFTEMSKALKRVKEVSVDATWKLRNDGKVYTLEAFPHASESDKPVFSKAIPAPSNPMPALTFCSARSPEFMDFIVCLGEEE